MQELDALKAQHRVRFLPECSSSAALLLAVLMTRLAEHTIPGTCWHTQLSIMHLTAVAECSVGCHRRRWLERLQPMSIFKHMQSLLQTLPWLPLSKWRPPGQARAQSR